MLMAQMTSPCVGGRAMKYASTLNFGGSDVELSAHAVRGECEVAILILNAVTARLACTAQ